MAIKNLTPREAIQDSIDEGVENFLFAIVREASYAGEAGVNAARRVNSSNSDKGYTDQTGNLRSSINYKVSLDGKLMDGREFPQVLEGAEGKKKGEDFAEDAAKGFDHSVALVLVAGMEYASQVQNGHRLRGESGRVTRPRDVLDTGWLVAQKEFEHGLNNLKS